MTKANEIRNMIAASKSAGATEVGNELIVAVMAKFNFGRQLARAYLNNNWAKVEAPVVVAKPKKELSMTPGAIRKRELRAAKKAEA